MEGRKSANRGVLGRTSVLQVKRIEVETQDTLAMGSLRYGQ